MNLREMASFGLGVAIGGLRLHAHLPRTLGAKIVHDPGYEARKTAERGGRTSNFVKSFGSRTPIDPKLVRTHVPDPVKEFHFLITWPGETEPREGSVKVNLKTRRVETGGEALFDKEHNEAREPAKAFSWPIAAVCFVPVVAAKAYYRAIEAREGMSCHGWEIYRQLAPQLEPADAALLREALRNTFAHEQWREQKVTLDEAKRLLATCHRQVEEIPDDGSIPHDATTHVFHWFTEAQGGERVAYGSFGKDGLGEIDVLGSSFYDEEAKTLAGFHATTRAVPHEGDAA